MMDVMLIEPRRGVPASQLEDKLRYVHNTSMNVFNSITEAGHPIFQYLRWVADAEQQLRPVLTADDLYRLLLTQRYWATYANPLDTPANVGSVRAAVLEHQTLFDEMARAVDAERRRWTSAVPEAVWVIADTNVHLHHPSDWDAIDWRSVVGWQNRSRAAVRVVLPALVVDELDSAKRSGKGETASRARTTIRSIVTAFTADPSSTWQMHPATPEVAATDVTLLMDDPTHRRLEKADDELVDRALLLSSFTDHPVLFVSYDGGAVLRARTAGLPVRHLVHSMEGN